MKALHSIKTNDSLEQKALRGLRHAFRDHPHFDAELRPDGVWFTFSDNQSFPTIWTPLADDTQGYADRDPQGPTR